MVARFLVAISLCILAAGLARAGEMIVVRSTADAYRTGTLIAPDIRLSVPDGGSVTLMDAYGRTQTVEGPFEGLATTRAGDERGRLSAVADLFSRRAHAERSIGGMRGDEVERIVAGVIPSSDRRFCLSADAPAEIFLSPRTFARVLAIRTDGGGEVEIEVQPRTVSVDWPAVLSPARAARYDFFEDMRPAGSVLMVRIGSARDTDTALATLMRNGCLRQAADLLVARAKAEAGR